MVQSLVVLSRARSTFGGAAPAVVAWLVLGCQAGSATPDGSAATAGAGGSAATAGAGGSAATAGAGGSAATAGAGGGAAIPTGCGKDLSGTWDLIAMTGIDTIGAGVMVINADTLSIAVGTFQVPTGHLDYSSANGTKQASWRQGSGGLHTFGVENTPAPLNAGSIPLALGGAWTFTGKIGSCMADVGVGLVSGKCTSNEGDYNVGNFDWPTHVPYMVNGRTYTATRMATAASSFGDLGGTWLAQSDAAFARSCTVTVNGNKLTAQCTVDRFAGTTELTIGDDCIASGLNNGGHEISGRRR
jgi:hypothetical protein